MAKETKKQPSQPPVSEQAPPVQDAYDWSQEQSTGFEATRAEDLGIPFLTLLQKGSPEVDEDHKDYETKKIEGADRGMIINTVTRQIVYNRDESKPLLFIPAFHEKLWQEWKPRGSGGGFVKSHGNATILMRATRNEKGEDVLPEGNIIITTSYFYGFALIEGEWVRVILPMQSTQLKKARAWLNMMHGIRVNDQMPPMYSHAYKLTTTQENNEKGNWWGWVIDIDHQLTKADALVIKEARQIAQDAAKSSIKALPQASSEDTTAGGEDGPPAELLDRQASVTR